MREDFSTGVKGILAKRVGHRCSNPKCRSLTSGPQKNPEKAINVGVASHITAASAGGPRYDDKLTPKQRESSENGIWLCQKCGKLIDNDPTRYTVEKLREWKKLAEQNALNEVEGGLKIETQGFSPGFVHGDFKINQTIINNYNTSKRRHWRKLGTFGYPIVSYEKDPRMRFLKFLLFHLPRAFKDSGYVSFISLVLPTHITVKDEILLRYLLFSPQTKYTGLLRRSWKYLHTNSIPIEDRQKYQESLNKEGSDQIDSWDLSVKFLEGIFPIELIYDPDEHKMSIGTPSIISSDPADYPDKVRTTSEFLTFVSSIPDNSVIGWEDAECILSYYPLAKFCMNLLDNQKYSLDDIRINDEDYEEYDYINNEYDVEVQRYS